MASVYFKLEWSSLSRLESWRISYSYIIIFSFTEVEPGQVQQVSFSDIACSLLFLEETTAGFGLKHFLRHSECKLILYVHRVARGIFVYTICHLSVFQVITISPRNSRWAEFKVKAPKYIGSSSVLTWILHKLVSSRILMHMPALKNNTNVTKTLSIW